MNGPPKLGVSGKNWTAAGRAPGNYFKNKYSRGARIAAPMVEFLSETAYTFGGPSMPRLQHSDPSGLRVIILKGEVVFRCHDLPLRIPSLIKK